MGSDIALSVVIPYYNEEKNIPLTIDRLKTCLLAYPYLNIEFILVNNGSTDESDRVFQTLLKDHQLLKHMRLVTVSKNQGYGYGILYGLSQARGAVLAWTHADMQTDPTDVIKAYELYVNELNSRQRDTLIKGRRKNRSFLEQFFTWGMQLVAFLVLRQWIDDINAQPKLFSRQFYRDYIKEQAPHDFSLDLYLLFQAKQQHIVTVDFPVYFAKRQHGQAKGGGSWRTRFSLIKRTLAYIYDLKKTH